MTNCAEDNVIVPACFYMTANIKPISQYYYFYGANIDTCFTLFIRTEYLFGEKL